MSARMRSFLLVAGVALAAVGVGVIAQRLMSLTSSMSNLVSTLASTTTATREVPPTPSPAEAQLLQAMSARIGVISQNLANAQTTAFKRRRVDANNGLETKVSDLPLDMTQGALESTGCATDVAITGEGFLHVKISPSVSDGTGYTRNGALFKDRNGDLVVGIGGGCGLIPPINLPISATNISIAQDGTVEYTAASGSNRIRAGQILLGRFTNSPALSPLGGGIYAESTASGPPVFCTPGNAGAGVLNEGYLESSNVDPIKESMNLVEAEQSMHLSGQALQTAIRARQTIADLDRR